MASAWVAGVTAIFALMSVIGEKFMNIDLSALVDAGLFMIIGWGIYKLSRIAAVAGLCLYLLERAYMWATVGPKNPVMAALLMTPDVNSGHETFFHAAICLA